jgi:hypothetical protein
MRRLSLHERLGEAAMRDNLAALDIAGKRWLDVKETVPRARQAIEIPAESAAHSSPLFPLYRQPGLLI